MKDRVIKNEILFKKITIIRLIYLSVSGIYTALCQSLLGCAVSSMLKYYKDNFDPNINKAWVKEIHACCGIFIGVSAPLFSLIFVLQKKKSLNHKKTIYYGYLVVQLMYLLFGTMPAYLYRNLFVVLGLRAIFGILVGFNEAFTIFEISDILSDTEIVKYTGIKISQPFMFALRSSCMSILSLICNSSGGKLIDETTRHSIEGVFNIFWMYVIPPCLIIPIFTTWVIMNNKQTSVLMFSSLDNNETTSLLDEQNLEEQQIIKNGDLKEVNITNDTVLIKEKDSLASLERIESNARYFNFTYEAVSVICSAFIIQMVFYIVPTSISIIVNDINPVNESTNSGLASGLCQCFSAIGSISYGLIMRELKSGKQNKPCIKATSKVLNIEKNKNKISQIILIHDSIMVVCCFLLAFSLLLFSYSKSYSLVAIAVSLCGFVSGPCMPNYNSTGSLITYVREKDIKNRGLISGFLIFSTFVSHTLTPLIFGDLMNLKEYEEVFVGSMVLLGFTLIFLCSKIVYDIICMKKQIKSNEIERQL